ncbi:hypothetical protein LH464_23985 [Neorhizobium sp. T786]|uniref:hypothetical protein n=1 Tax=Pseudorhizobium xiangyangii TaxID=2883104 RepID=UPI001CFF699E|nr:hypothetical protein [Neorhizobium xiangyangii]MCB5205507.1 hypothetical protein [Neorhizobium xiangyangii]
MITVRTYEHARKTGGGSSSKIEIEGIDCVLESEGYSAAVKTPAEVRVPDYGYASRPITARCTAPGYKSAVTSSSPFNKTAEQRLSSGGQSGGLAGVLVVALINAASDEKKHDFAYHPITVTMNRIGCEKQAGGCR